MSNIPITSTQSADSLLRALGEQLAAAGAAFDVVVVGGSALLVLGLASRATKDVDVLAVRTGGSLVSADPLPPALVEASDRVARDFGLPADWLNSGPAGLMDFGLPEGFAERVEVREYGPALTVRFASRFDQIHFKLYAAVDASTPGKHAADLRELSPTRDELIAAARWSLTHDPSDGYREMLERALEYFGVEDADLSA
ncbi:DUF6036 family nucleotidyltransferase [Conexibacter sp. JD483]|uniref:DUF6036 family nucleotidyltransferase n=1 Tax=unclassified Conexibacter TaxID=2627773 RepID=UPI002727C1A3|nr:MULTISPECIES: DUF6036 family nucleotidyltransferase [unclassified Conexibacter]MDO8188435.1 DUF6036 family nucleotidyltransferase [Conexibacter sp. CPCC 205706]MDO8199204.1 DUF6036 family nucleotidyltransferase [Conexibacter sp. CPCC 205762]MDR9372348.1 DUF6036 family nucleotidyltransferase [Conexibacter sp. JD483]